MSVVEVSVVSLAPGGLVIGGLIVAGMLMGRAYTNEIEKNNLINEEIARETIEANKSDMKTEFSNSVNMVLTEINDLDSDSREQLADEIKKLEKLPDQILANYNLDVYKSENHEKFINTMINDFNNTILEIIQRIEEVKIETNETKKLLETKSSQIETFTAKLVVPENYQNDLYSLTEQLKLINNISSIKEKSRQLQDLEIKIMSFAESCKIINTINLDSLKEEKIQPSDPDAANKIFQKEILEFHQKIKYLDLNVFNNLDSLVQESMESVAGQRLELIREQVKLKYGKLKEQVALTNVYRHNLVKLSYALLEFSGSEELLKQINVLLQNKYISKDNYDEIARRINDFVAHSRQTDFNKTNKKGLISKVKNSLENLGYSVIDETNETSETNEIPAKLENGEIVYLDTEFPDYKVMLKIDENNQIATRLVKFVATEAEKLNISTYQKQKDTEVARKWCKDYDRFIEEMKKQGVPIEIKLRKEPEEEDITYIVNKDLIKGNKQERSKKIRNDEMRL